MLRGEDGGRLDQWEWQFLLPPGGISSSLLAHVRLACLSSAEAVSHHINSTRTIHFYFHLSVRS